ncbi:MAG: hypothetical protein AVDCRST_MAG88-706, partial [uncultured Thermomicrobiales bacterium]
GNTWLAAPGQPAGPSSSTGAHGATGASSGYSRRDVGNGRV